MCICIKKNKTITNNTKKNKKKTSNTQRGYRSKKEDGGKAKGTHIWTKGNYKTHKQGGQEGEQQKRNGSKGKKVRVLERRITKQDERHHITATHSLAFRGALG